MSSVWSKYLQEKKDENVKILVYTKMPTESKAGQVVSRMLFGYIQDFDEETIRLKDQECIIERAEIGSIKPDEGRNSHR